MDPRAYDVMTQALQATTVGVALVTVVSVLVLLVRAVTRTPPRAGSRRGSIAVVVVSIPAGGVGAIRVPGPHGVGLVPARGHDGEAVPLGAHVLIVDLRQRVAEVCAYPESERVP